MSAPHRVLDIWPHVDPRFGGVGPAAAALAQAVQGCRGWKSDLLAICHRSESDRHRDIPESVEIVVEQSPRPLADLRLVAPLENAILKADLCHVHGIWLPHALTATRIAERLGKPIVSSLHGMLEKWDLANGQLKKRIYSALFQRPSLSKSACLRALSEQEAVDLRNYGLKNLIAVVPNGVSPLFKVDAADFLAKFPELNGKPVVLFLGRIHRKKGILDLLRAWPTVIRSHSDAHLLVAGGDYENTGAIARQIVSESRIQNNVTFCGVLNGDSKLQALSIATAFCLPSYSEGMSVAVLEALSIGLPVIVTQACNIGGVAESGAGYVIPLEVQALSQSLCECLSLSGSQRQSMSEAARLLARSRYDWSQSGEAMRSVYEWLLGGTRPACVISY